MRRHADRERVERFMEAFGAAAAVQATAYLTGGATAVLYGWRASTIDVDLRLEPERDELLRLLPRLKDELDLNIELASPADFLPELPGWRDRSLFIRTVDRVTFRHYDLYSQFLAKVERSHAQDRADIRQLLDRGLVDPAVAHLLFAEIEGQLYRFPAVDPPSFQQALEEALGPTAQ